MQPPAFLHAVHHDGSARYVSNPYPTLGETVTLRVRTAPDAPIRAILVRTVPDGEQHFTQLTPVSQDQVCQWWQVELEVWMPIVTYRFVLVTDHGPWVYNGAGLHPYQPTDYHDFRLIADYSAPRWVSNSIFYQIFPDRFADGDPSNNPRTGAWEYRGHTVEARDWNEQPGRSDPSLEFYGGDLQGIVQRLPYLEHLGVNALYLNPIFCAPSVHKYDVTDFEQIDLHFGGNMALAALRQALHDRGMRLLLDIVPNHCGVNHPWFQDALADPYSERSDHFIFTRHPDYVSWLGVPTLPKLNYRSQALREGMYAGPDSIFRRWLRPPYSIDGWRVDVANMLGQYRATRLNADVTRGIREAVKEENPEAYLLAENFFDATGQLQGDQYDANMNYRGFTVPLWEWLNEQRIRHPSITEEFLMPTRLSTYGLTQAWQTFRAPIPWVIALQQFTLIDSHDTARILSLVGGNDRLHRLAAVLQFTYPGVPCVFYGDEIGLEGAEATSARRTMPWNEDQWDHDLLAFYRRLIALRRSSAALATGGFQMLYTDDDTVAFLRDTQDEQLIVVGYRGAEERAAGLLPVAYGAIPDGTRFTEVLTGAEAVVQDGHLPLPAMQQGPAIWSVLHDE
jgi:alpha-glucosidase